MKAILLLQETNNNAMMDFKNNIESLRRLQSLNFNEHEDMDRIEFRKDSSASRITFSKAHFHRRNISE